MQLLTWSELVAFVQNIKGEGEEGAKTLLYEIYRDP